MSNNTLETVVPPGDTPPDAVAAALRTAMREDREEEAVLRGPQLRMRAPYVPPADIATADRRLYNLMVQAPRESVLGGELYASLLTEYQELNDRLIFADLICVGYGKGMARFKMWQDWKTLSRDFARALGESSAAAGLNWAPTVMSARLGLAVTPELRVAALFAQQDMPAATFDLPLLATDLVAQYAGGNASIPPTDFISGKASLSAVKLATLLVASSEVSEDVAVASEPAFTTAIGRAIARAIEDAILNGDTLINGATAQDVDLQSNSVVISSVTAGAPSATLTTAANFLTSKVKPGDTISKADVPAGTTVVSIQSATSLTMSALSTGGGTTSNATFARPAALSNDRRLAWTGLRKRALISGMPNQDMATWSDANLTAIRKAMGLYGSPSRCAIVVGNAGRAKFLTPASGFVGFMTMDQLGPLATPLPGQFGDWLGTPVIHSEFMRDDVNATGVNDATAGNTFSTLLVVNRDAYVLGRRRAVTVERTNNFAFDTDQADIRGTWRGHFQELFATTAAANKSVGIGRNFS